MPRIEIVLGDTDPAASVLSMANVRAGFRLGELIVFADDEFPATMPAKVFKFGGNCTGVSAMAIHIITGGRLIDRDWFNDVVLTRLEDGFGIIVIYADSPYVFGPEGGSP